MSATQVHCQLHHPLSNNNTCTTATNPTGHRGRSHLLLGWLSSKSVGRPCLNQQIGTAYFTVRSTMQVSHADPSLHAATTTRKWPQVGLGNQKDSTLALETGKMQAFARPTSPLNILKWVLTATSAMQIPPLNSTPLKPDVGVHWPLHPISTTFKLQHLHSYIPTKHLDNTP